MMINNLKNNKGFTLIEMLVGTAIGLMMLGAAVYTFTKQQSMLRDQDVDAKVRSQGRLAINKIAKDLRNAGAGIPVSLKFETASSSVFKYKLNPHDGPTAVAVDITATDTVITLTGVDNFTDGQDVVLYILGEMYKLIPTSPNLVAKIVTVDTGAVTLELDTGATVNYPSYQTVINPYDTITYTHDTVNNRITRTVNGVDFPFIEDVTGLTFVYKDKDEVDLGNPVTATDRPKIRKVEVNLSFQDPQVANAKVSLRTDVYIRNTGDDI